MLQLPQLNAYLSAMQSRGFDAQTVLHASGLSEQDLRSPALRISLAQTQCIIENMMKLAGSEALGFEIGGDIRIADMGLVGHAMIAAPNFRQTIELWKRFASTLYGSMLELEFEEANQTGADWALHITQPLPRGPAYRFFLEEYLSLSATLGELMSSSPVSYSRVEVTYPPPRHHSLYETLFQCPVIFNAEHNRILVRRPRLDDPIETRDEHLFEIYRNYCQRQSQQLAVESSHAYEVHRYLLKNLGQEPKLEAVAQELGYSSRTLKRRLLEEGRSFRELVAEFRQDFACENLANSTLSIKEVAYLLGYRDTKPFLRAFKRWTGKTVGEYRQFGV